MECIVLAGGLGTRLRGVLGNVPKCLAPINDKPFLHYLLRSLEAEGCTHIILALGVGAGQVLENLPELSAGCRLSYVIEETPFGTGGAIQLAAQKTEADEFFVVNGDTFFAVELQQLSRFRKEKNAGIALALKEMFSFERYGAVDIDTGGRIISFREKQFCAQGLINGGIHCIDKKAFETMSRSGAYSFEQAILEPEAAAGKLFGMPFDTWFIDIGVPEDYARANAEAAMLLPRA